MNDEKMSVSAPRGRRSNRSKRSKKSRQKPLTGILKPGSALTSGNGRSASLALVVEPWMPVFPATIRKRLRYADTFTLTSTAGVVTSYVLRANDLFDPDFTGTGHQPMGFDQLMLWFNHFCVIRAKLTCIFRSTTSNTTTVCIRQDGASAPLTVINRIVELGGCVIDDLGYLASTNDTKKLELLVDMARLQGVAPLALTADPTLRGDAATSPTEVTYFHIQNWNSDGVTSSVIVDFILEQEAYFLEPRDDVES